MNLDCVLCTVPFELWLVQDTRLVGTLQRGSILHSCLEKRKEKNSCNKCFIENKTTYKLWKIEKNIARIMKAALYKCTGKSSLKLFISVLSDLLESQNYESFIQIRIYESINEYALVVCKC